MEATTAQRITPPAQFTPAPENAKPRPYPATSLKIIEWRWRDAQDTPPAFSRAERVRDPEDLYKRYRFLFDGLMRERFVVFLLNANMKVIAVEIVTEGTLDTSLVHPREVYRAAVRGMAAAIIIAHNHPSGNPEPSREDCQMTTQLKEAGKILSIPLQDHIIFTEDGCTSLMERGLI